ncbi:Protein-tyrosine-phosphatase IBR5 [Capsicum baccatum]|uniref:Protein-tyrosine-phosphatase IBR5 n=1 Tax=Capsicum baccatum TaxID=33114 RepID=A0A2G2WD19_CAPBA|nr:Protein-tyrosine-phosphatase IBR5 [Capsicum baccatum]
MSPVSLLAAGSVDLMTKVCCRNKVAGKKIAATSLECRRKVAGVTPERLPEQCEKDRARVLVHCMSGRSRSPAIVIAYLMKSKGWKLAQSYHWVKDRRPSIDLNQGVYQQLQEYEQKIFGSLENQPASVMPVVPSPVPSFTFNYAKPSDSVQIPAFNSSVATSISAHPAFAVPPQEFTFGAADNQRNVLDNLLISNQNPNNTDIAMDGLAKDYCSLEHRVISRDQALAKAMIANVKANNQAAVLRHQESNLATARLHDFMRMNPPEFFGSKIGEDLQLYLDKVKMITQVMYVTKEKSVKLASYRLKDVAYDWVIMWKKSMSENAAPMSWQVF